MENLFTCHASLIMDVSKSWGYAREPVMQRMADGSLLCTFLSGGKVEPENNNVTLVTRSYDDGESWSEPEILFYHRSRAAYTTEIFGEGERTLLFVHTYAAESRYREISTYISTTDDNGRSWSSPVSLPGAAGHVNVRRGIVLSDQRWLFPVYWQSVRERWDWEQIPTSNEIHMHWPGHCGVLQSKDGGKHYQMFGDLSAEYFLMENNCVEAEPGHVIMLMRAEGSPVLYRSDSYDYGETWEEAYASDIFSASSKIALLKDDDKILLIHNARADSEKMERKNLSIWVSADGMRTWKRKHRLTQENVTMFYPHAVLDKKKKAIYIACENAKQSYCLKVNLAELYD